MTESEKGNDRGENKRARVMTGGRGGAGGEMTGGGGGGGREGVEEGGDAVMT